MSGELDSPDYHDTNLTYGTMCDTPEEKEIARLEKRIARLSAACQAALLFHSGSPWDEEKRHKWAVFTQQLLGVPIQREKDEDYRAGNEATTKHLCDAVRAALQP